MREPEGFGEYVEGARHGLLRTAFLLTGDYHAAEDLVQTTLVKVWPQWTRVVSREGSISAYVHRTMTHAFISSTRRRRWREVLGADHATEPIHAEAEDQIIRKLTVTACLRRLPPRQRLAIVLRVYLDMTEAETARMMGCSVGTVKSTVSRGLARLEVVMTTSNDKGGEYV